MTDALCGPANPLQNFQKHGQADRTLQQDRLVSRQQHGGQGFRSEHPGQAGMLDPEFEAFQAGQSPFSQLNGSAYEQQQHPAFSHVSQQQIGDPFAGGWANDFAKLQISQQPLSRPSFHGQQMYRPANQQSSGQSPWHTDFAHSLQTSPSTSVQQAPAYQPRFGGMLGSSAFANVQQPMGYVAPNAQSQAPTSEERWKGKGRWQAEDVQETAAFEAEFEALAREEMQQMEAQKQEQETTVDSDLIQDPTKDEVLEDFDFDKFLRETDIDEDLAEAKFAKDLAQQDDRVEEHLREMDSRLSANGLLPAGAQNMETMKQMPSYDDLQRQQPQQPQTREQPQTRPQEEIDAELSRTAGALLESVAHDKSEKFQKSQFFSFMRQLRDYEVRVEGDKVVDVSQPKTQDEQVRDGEQSDPNELVRDPAGIFATGVKLTRPRSVGSSLPARRRHRSISARRDFDDEFRSS